MSKLTDFTDGAKLDMPSQKHSLTQANLTIQLGNNNKLTTFVELSLDAHTIDLSSFDLKEKDELIPDICAYFAAPPLDERLGSDAIHVTQIPDLIIEILSPSQTVNSLINKIEAYFVLGVKSCWLVIPALEAVMVFSQLQNYQFFAMNDQEVIDNIMDIRVPMLQIFKWRSPAVHRSS